MDTSGSLPPPDDSLRLETRVTGRSASLDTLHVFVLASFAIAQPIYDRLGPRGAYLIDLKVGPPSIALLVLLISLAIPALLVSVEGASRRRGPRAADGSHAVILF